MPGTRKGKLRDSVYWTQLSVRTVQHLLVCHDDENAEDWQAARVAKQASAGVMDGLMKSMFGGAAEALGIGDAAGVVDPSNQEPPASTDTVLGHGELDIGSDLRGTKPRDVKVPLSLPISSALHFSGLSEKLSGLLTRRLGAAGALSENGAARVRVRPTPPSGNARILETPVIATPP